MALAWSITDGSLPPGMSIFVDSTSRVAYLRGTPSKTGVFEFELSVVDVDDRNVSKTYTVVVDKKLRWSGAVIQQTTLPTGERTVPYSITDRLLVEMLGASTNETFNISVVNGSLPPGISISKVDYNVAASAIATTLDYAYVNFSGTPTAVGTYTFTLRVTAGSKVQDITLSIPIKDKYVPPPPPPPPAPTYSLTADRTSVNEGGSVTFTLTTTGVASGTTFPYRITGVSANDIVGGALTGNFTVTTRFEDYMLAPGEPERREITDGTVTISIAADLETEGTETLTLTVDNTTPQRSVNISVSDTSVTPDPPTYSLVASSPTVTYGSDVTFTLNTTRVNNNTRIYYIITGPSSAMLNNVSLRGSILINNNIGSVTFKTVDFPEYNPVTMTMTLYSDSNYSTPLNVARSISLQDPAPTYSLLLNSSDGQYNETTKREIVIELKTTNVQNGTLVPWKIQPDIPQSAGLTTADFDGLSAFTGNFTVSSNYAKLTLTIKADKTLEGTESFTFQLTNNPTINKRCFISSTSGPAPSYVLELLKANTSTGVLEPIRGLDEYEVVLGQLFALKLIVTNPAAVTIKNTISGDKITSDTFDGAALSYNISPNQYSSGEVTKQFQTKNDGVTIERIVTFTLTDSVTGNVLLQTNLPLLPAPLPPPNNTIDNNTPNPDINQPGSSIGTGTALGGGSTTNRIGEGTLNQF